MGTAGNTLIEERPGAKKTMKINTWKQFSMAWSIYTASVMQRDSINGTLINNPNGKMN